MRVHAWGEKIPWKSQCCQEEAEQLKKFHVLRGHSFHHFKGTGFSTVRFSVKRAEVWQHQELKYIPNSDSKPFFGVFIVTFFFKADCQSLHDDEIQDFSNFLLLFVLQCEPCRFLHRILTWISRNRRPPYGHLELSFGIINLSTCPRTFSKMLFKHTFPVC